MLIPANDARIITITFEDFFSIYNYTWSAMLPVMLVCNNKSTYTAVREDGSWCVLKPASLRTSIPEFTVASHDTTGGMVTKISEAAMIAILGIDVYIVKVGTDHSLQALDGSLRGKIPEDWLGTAIRRIDDPKAD
ncbi:unnamed protein product [Cuscuta campestris]|uniref:Isopentenyl phosphate kinase n=1 Tax=Cuscuta campestris TaxID=132261 RepID=A0A484L7T9_9ASTE|nr:unnamed protein product [Cuscuta campestris]